MAKFFILAGVFLAALGLVFSSWHGIPLLGMLPRDMFVGKGSFQFYFPLATCVVLSAVLTIIVNLILSLSKQAFSSRDGGYEDVLSREQKGM